MCGIVGLFAFNEMPDKKSEKIRQESMIILGTELLQLTQVRGKDATGVAVMFDSGDYMGLKMGIPAEEFVSRFGDTEKDFQGFLNIWRRKKAVGRIFLGHCRKSSVGNSDDNKNNHPIKIGDIIGIHNGTLTNHDQIFKKLDSQRDGTVDSEAIFRLVHHYTENGTKPFTIAALNEVCNRLNGSYACLTFSGNNPFQVAAFRDDRPMEFAIIRPLKLVVVASEQGFMKRALFRYNTMAALLDLGLPILRKDDVELLPTTEKSIYLFDLRKDIVAGTKIETLFEKKFSVVADKIWKDVPATKTYSTPYKHQFGGGAAATTGAAAAGANAAVGAIGTPKKHTEVVASKPTTVNGTKHNMAAPGTTQNIGNQRLLGMAWNHHSRRHEEVSDDSEEVCRKYGPVIINNEENTMTDLHTKAVINIGEKNTSTQTASQRDSDDFTLSEQGGAVDTLIDSPAKIVEMEVKPTAAKQSDDIIAIHKHNKEVEAPEVQEVDFSTYPEVLELAHAATKAEANLTSNADLMMAVEVKSEDVLKSMPLHSLANRIKKHYFSRGFYAGYVACMKKTKKLDVEQQRVLLVKARDKVVAAQQTVKGSKALVNLLDKIIAIVSLSDEQILRATESFIAGGGAVTLKDMQNICRPGDFRRNPVLGRISSALSKIENGE